MTETAVPGAACGPATATRPAPAATRPACAATRPAPATQRMRIAEKTSLAEGVAGLALEPADGSAAPPWEPGAHVDLHLPGGLIRQYSLCGDPADRRRWRVAVLREPAGRGGSAVIHDALDAGTELRVTGPRNNFPLAAADRYLFIAGGIGITPIRPMLAEASRLGRPWHLLYGGRRRASMAFLDELEAWPGQVTVRPEDEFGLLDLDALLGAPQPGTAVYCCGPEPMLRAAEARCAAWPAGTLHLERFRPAEPVTAAMDASGTGEAADGAGGPFEVELATSGRVVQVPAGTSILAALRGAGVEVLSSCEEGTCGTCETGVLAGRPDHRDCVLDPSERDAGDLMMICVSRARTPRLVLDL
jgi:ferredoxin-NADP reductase